MCLQCARNVDALMVPGWCFVSVTHCVNRVNELFTARYLTEFLTQLFDVRVDGPVTDNSMVTIDSVHQLAARVNAPWLRDQGSKERKLNGR